MAHATGPPASLPGGAAQGSTARLLTLGSLTEEWLPRTVWQVGQLGCVGAVGWEIAGKRCDSKLQGKTLRDGRVAGGVMTSVLRGVDVTGVLRGVPGVVSNGEWRERGRLQVANS